MSRASICPVCVLCVSQNRLSLAAPSLAVTGSGVQPGPSSPAPLPSPSLGEGGSAATSYHLARCELLALRWPSVTLQVRWARSPAHLSETLACEWAWLLAEGSSLVK